MFRAWSCESLFSYGEKPQALELADTITITIFREKMVEAIIALGSNIDPFDSIEKGLVALRKDLSIKEISKFYLNSAVGTSEGQHEFLNGVVLLKLN